MAATAARAANSDETDGHHPSGVHPRKRVRNPDWQAIDTRNEALEALAASLNDDPSSRPVREYLLKIVRQCAALTTTSIIMGSYEHEAPTVSMAVSTLRAWMDHLFEEFEQVALEQKGTPGTWGLTGRSLPEFARAYYLGFVQPAFRRIPPEDLAPICAERVLASAEALCKAMRRELR